jgi:hypothetical protein
MLELASIASPFIRVQAFHAGIAMRDPRTAADEDHQQERMVIKEEVASVAVGTF